MMNRAVLKDSDPRKWEMKAHTKVKHDILSKYLIVWIRKLSKFKKICYFDCFAGRGKYEGGEWGSPIIAMRIAAGQSHLFNKFICTFIEKDKDNYESLIKEIKKEIGKDPEKYNKVKIVEPFNDEFSNIAEKLLKEIEKIAPSFFFIDPFGFSGLPFEVIKGLMLYEHSEVFITLMSRDICRFYTDSLKEKTLSDLFGSEDWKSFKALSGDERENKTRDLYISQLKKIAKYVRVYKVSMDELRRTGYYLIHATNVFDGFKLITDIMYRQSKTGGIFAYLGPDEGQMRLCDFSDDNEELKKFLISKFSGKSVKFEKVIEECYQLVDDCIEKIYRAALKELEKENKINVKRVTSKTTIGLSGKDIINFK